MIYLLNEMVAKSEGMGKRLVNWQLLQSIATTNIRMFFNKYKKHRENSQCFKLCYTLAGCTIAGRMCQCKLYVELLLNPKYRLSPSILPLDCNAKNAVIFETSKKQVKLLTIIIKPTCKLNTILSVLLFFCLTLYPHSLDLYKS